MIREALHLTLLRHGRSRADDENVHEGRYDSPLTTVGISQAHHLAKYWKQNPPAFQQIISSPLSRAQQTAEIIAETLELSYEPCDDWMEFDNGPLH